MPTEPVYFECDYVNWRGVRARRRLRAIRFWHGSNAWHAEPSLMLRAFDIDRDDERDFRVLDFDFDTFYALHDAPAAPPCEEPDHAD